MTHDIHPIDVDSLTAIDMHAHIETDGHGHFSLNDVLMEASAAYFKDPGQRAPRIAEMAEHYRALRMAAVVFTVDAHSATGHPAISSELIAEEAAQFPDVLIPFASVDPWDGKAAVVKARRLVDSYGSKGFKFHPTLQGFEPNSLQFYPLYAALEELGAVAVFHTGQTGIGAGLPGGAGLKLRYSDPMLIDDVAADFPALKIVMAHPAVPWVDASISIATHKSNVYIDLSGWSPKYFPAQLVKQANSLLKHKVLFGSDYPVISPERWMAAFDQLDIRDEVRPLILKENARGLLGL